jgi:hypothetical protein
MLFGLGLSQLSFAGLFGRASVNAVVGAALIELAARHAGRWGVR